MGGFDIGLTFFDIKTNEITYGCGSPNEFNIYDIIAKDDSQLLLFTDAGLYDCNKDKVSRRDYINFYYHNRSQCICHIADSIYLVVFGNLIVWNEQTNKMLIEISDDFAYSIKRVMSSNHFIIKTHKKVKLLTFIDFKSYLFSLNDLIDAEGSGLTDSLQV